MSGAHQALRERDERGMSVTELMVVVLLTGLVLSSLLSVLQSVTANERVQQAKVNNQERVRFVLGQLTRDLRSANPLLSPSTVANAATTVDVALGASTGTQSYVRWSLSGTTLTRAVSTTQGGSPTSSRVMLTNVRNATRGITLFRYFRSSTVEMATSGAGAVAAGDIGNCTIRVRIAIASDSDPGPAPFLEETDAEIRNRLPGGLGC